MDKVVACCRLYFRQAMTVISAGGKSSPSICYDFFKLALTDITWLPCELIGVGGRKRKKGAITKTRFQRELFDFHMNNATTDNSFALLKLIKECLSQWIDEANAMKKILQERALEEDDDELARMRDILDLVILCIPVLKKQSLNTMKDFAFISDLDFDGVDLTQTAQKRPYIVTEKGESITWNELLKRKVRKLHAQ